MNLTAPHVINKSPAFSVNCRLFTVFKSLASGPCSEPGSVARHTDTTVNGGEDAKKFSPTSQAVTRHDDIWERGYIAPGIRNLGIRWT